MKCNEIPIMKFIFGSWYSNARPVWIVTWSFKPFYQFLILMNFPKGYYTAIDSKNMVDIAKKTDDKQQIEIIAYLRLVKASLALKQYNDAILHGN
jgi:hypothetical protein